MRHMSNCDWMLFLASQGPLSEIEPMASCLHGKCSNLLSRLTKQSDKNKIVMASLTPFDR